MALLSVRGVTKAFGGVTAVAGVSLDLERGVVVGIIGPNGSGKTTLLNLVNGVHRPDGGEVWFKDRPIHGLSPHAVAERGIARTFQTPRVFRSMKVLENLLVPVLHSGEEEGALRDRALGLLESVGLGEHAARFAGELSGGQQKLLEFARAMMSGPDLILMDEPLAGVHPELKKVLLEQIDALRGRVAFLIVSHDIPSILGAAERLVVMDSGTKIVEGRPEVVRRDAKVVEAYLGV